MLDRIEEIFVPTTVNSVEDLMKFLAEEIVKRGGDPSTVKMLNTKETIPNVAFSEEWPCWTLNFDILPPDPGFKAKPEELDV